MGSIQGKVEPEDWRYALFIANRKAGRSDAETAKNFGFGSPKELYRQFQYDGFEICAVCGETRVPADHCDPTPKSRDRKTKTLGESVELPPAEDAIGLFENMLDRLRKETQTLRGREEYQRGKNFEGVRVLPDGEGRKALGVSKHPPEPLTTLIAVYALVYGSSDSPGMQKLLRKLHPSKPWEVRERMSDESLKRLNEARKRAGKEPYPPNLEFKKRVPDSRAVDTSKLNEKIRHLKLYAEQVAKIIRGGHVGVGAPTPTLLPRYQAVVKRVAALHQQGLSNAEIAEDINGLYEGEWFEEPFTEDEVQWLVNLSASSE